MFYRSRSATPSSYPGTPPQNPMDAINPNFQSAVGSALATSGLQSNQIKSNDFQPRNYSDFIRSLAAKYNNSNPNEYDEKCSYFFFYTSYASIICNLFMFLPNYTEYILYYHRREGTNDVRYRHLYVHRKGRKEKRVHLT